MVDAVSGDLGSAGPLLERRSPADTLLQSSTPAGAGSSRTLRWQNPDFPSLAGERIVVRATGPGGCGVACGPDDVYRIRAWDTTYSIPRFNNTGSQVTVLLVQNPADRPVARARVVLGTCSATLATFVPGHADARGSCSS